MTLKEWLTANDIAVAQFANTISRSPEAVRRYVVGERIPDRETMPLIVDATGGDVTPNDFFGVCVTPALCTVCDHRLDDATIRACSVRSCPNAQSEAACARLHLAGVGRAALLGDDARKSQQEAA